VALHHQRDRASGRRPGVAPVWLLEVEIQGNKGSWTIIKINVVTFSHEDIGGSTLVRGSARLNTSEKNTL